MAQRSSLFWPFAEPAIHSAITAVYSPTKGHTASYTGCLAMAPLSTHMSPLRQWRREKQPSRPKCAAASPRKSYTLHIGGQIVQEGFARLCVGGLACSVHVRNVTRAACSRSCMTGSDRRVLELPRDRCLVIGDGGSVKR